MKPKKVVMLWILMAAAPAWATTLERGQVLLSAQTGVTSRNGTVFRLGFESPVSRHFTIGFSLSQRQFQPWLRSYSEWQPAADSPYLYPDPASWAVTTNSFALEGAYHFTFIPVRRLDLFTGLGVGLKLDGVGSVRNGRGWLNNLDGQAFAGVNYFLTEKLGLGGRVNAQHDQYFGMIYGGSLGLTLRFK